MATWGRWGWASAAALSIGLALAVAGPSVAWAQELVVNLKTAKAIGLTVPPSILAQADQIIA